MTPTALLAFDGLLLAAAACDLRRYRIPNAIPVLLMFAAPALAFPANAGEALGRAGTFGLATSVAGLLWLRGLMGGGDLKLLMAVAVWIPLGGLAPFALALGLASGVQGLLALIWLQMTSGAPLAEAGRSRLPFAVSIAAAGLAWSAGSGPI